MPAHVPRSWGDGQRLAAQRWMALLFAPPPYTSRAPNPRRCAKRCFQCLETRNVARTTPVLHCKLPSAHTLVGRAAGSADDSQGARVVSFAQLQNCAMAAFHSTPHGKRHAFQPSPLPKRTATKKHRICRQPTSYRDHVHKQWYRYLFVVITFTDLLGTCACAFQMSDNFNACE